MPQVEIKGFKGLDLRKLPESGGEVRLVDCNNMSITPGNSIAVKPAQVPYVALAATDSSVGLYTIGNQLHVCMLWDNTTNPLPPMDANIIYDFISNDATGDATGNTISEVTSALAWDGRPYLVVKRSSGVYEHHILPDSPFTPLPRCTVTNSTTLNFASPFPPSLIAHCTVELIYAGSTLGTYFVNSINSDTGSIVLNTAQPLANGSTVDVRVYNVGKTLVDTPFQPGRSAVLASDKIWATNILENNVWFSSTVNGPTDWTNPSDAGFLPTNLHVNGHQTIQTLAIFNGQLCVFYDNTLQLWKIGADPALHSLVGSVNGAGTRHPRSVANVMGDVYYYSNGGFRSVQAVITTGQLKADDIGAPIWPLTRDFTASNEIVCTWAETLSQYICQIDSSYAYVLTNSPRSKTLDWSKWTLSLSSFYECNGYLFGRSGLNIYRFDSNAWDTEDAYAILSHVDGGTNRIKHWGVVSASQAGSAHWSVITEPRNPSGSEIPIGVVTGSFDGIGTVYLGCATNRIAFKFSVGVQVATYAPWNIDNLTVEYKVGNHV